MVDIYESGEMYLETILLLQKKKGIVRAVDICAELGFAKSSVSAALSALKEPCSVTLYSDSRYLVDAVNLGWARAWQAAGWRGGKVKNPDLWQKLLELLALHDVTFLWVRGHAGHPENERCDALATAEADRFRADTGSAPPIISQGENT